MSRDGPAIAKGTGRPPARPAKDHGARITVTLENEWHQWCYRYLEAYFPAFRAMGVSPAECRRRLGKGAWARFVGLPRSKAVRFAGAVRAILLYRQGAKYARDLRYDPAVYFDLLRIFLEEPKEKTPSDWHLRRVANYTLDDLRSAIRFSRLRKKCTTNEGLILFADTRRMFERAGRLDDFNPQWSQKRMIREHDRLVEADPTLKFQTEPYEKCLDLPALTLDGAACIPLRSGYDAYCEAQDMQHCVDDYADDMESGRHAIYSIRNQAGRSTASWYRDRRAKREKLWFDQHKGVKNARPPKGHVAIRKRLEREVSRALNSEPAGPKYVVEDIAA